MKKYELIVEEEYQNERIDKYISDVLADFSRSYIQKLISDDNVLLNEKKVKASSKVAEGDNVTVFTPDNIIPDIIPENIPLDILYEDKDVIVVNKPKDMVVHPAVGNYSGTVVNALLAHCKELSDVNGYYRPGIVHRIDKDTSGLLVCAKNNVAHAFLSDQLKDKTCFRKYYALVSGVIENNEGEINAPIGRSEKDRQMMTVTPKNSKEAITEFKVLERYDNSTLIECELKTGRTHQIRVHMKYINHSVFNDNKYSKKVIDETGQYLHAYYLSFIHPKTKKRVEFTTEMPEYMKEYIKEKGGHFAA